MIVKVLSVYDSCTGAFLPPWCARSKGEALRSVMAALEQPDHLFAKHAKDYTVFELGEFDDESGHFRIWDAKVPYGNMLEFLSKPEAPRSPVRPVDSAQLDIEDALGVRKGSVK